MNPRPTGPKPVALPSCATPRKIIGQDHQILFTYCFVIADRFTLCNYAVLIKWQGQKDLNPRHVVLETTALPTELYPYNKYGGEGEIRTRAALNEP